jgi:hypothetical protein
MEHLNDLFNGVVSLKGLAAMLGLSIFGLIGVIGLLKKAIAEIIEAVNKINYTIKKYQNFFQSPEAKKDFEDTLLEVDQALEAIADILTKIRLYSLAKQLRDTIRI